MEKTCDLITARIGIVLRTIMRFYPVSARVNQLAYTYDNTGFRQFTLAVKDLRTGKTLADHAERVGSVVWGGWPRLALTCTTTKAAAPRFVAFEAWALVQPIAKDFLRCARTATISSTEQQSLMFTPPTSQLHSPTRRL